MAALKEKKAPGIRKSGGVENGLVMVTRKRRNRGGPRVKCRVEGCKHKPFKNAWGESVHFSRMHNERVANSKMATFQIVPPRSADTVEVPVRSHQESVNGSVAAIQVAHINTFINVQKMWTERAVNAEDPSVRSAIIQCLLDLIREFKA